MPILFARPRGLKSATLLRGSRPHCGGIGQPEKSGEDRLIGKSRSSIAWRFILAALLVTSVARADEPARSARRQLQEGNKHLAEGKYQEALAAYEAAKELLPDAPEVDYDRGIALYRLGEFDKARSAFQDALRTDERELEAKTKYNLGRCAHAEAMAGADDRADAIDALSRAIRFYEDALQIEPEDEDARRNKKLAEHLRAYLERKLEQEQQQPEQRDGTTSQPTTQPGKPSTTQPDQQQPTSQPTSQPQSHDGHEQEGRKADQQQDGQQPQDATEPTGGEDQDERQEGQAAKDGSAERHELTPEQAERFLQDARDAERRRREDKRRRALRMRGRIPVDKDW